MSQAGVISTTIGPPPPTVATSYVTDVNSPAIPIANVLNVFGRDITTNNVFGIQTDGSSGSNVLTVQLTNRFHGSITTTDATPTILASCPMVTNPAVFNFIVNVVGYDLTNNAGISVVATLTFRTTGGVPVILSPDDFITQQDVTFAGGGGSIIFTGTAAAMNVVVTGALATTIDWFAHGTYTVVS
jgi:hypothetical protein